MNLQYIIIFNNYGTVCYTVKAIKNREEREKWGNETLQFNQQKNAKTKMFLWTSIILVYILLFYEKLLFGRLNKN